MAFADVPKIPEEYKPRVEELTKKIKSKEITINEVASNILEVLGKVTIASNGIRAEGEFGRFEIDERAITATRDTLLYACELLPRFWGKKFLIQRGDSVRKVKIGLGLRKSRASAKDLNDQNIPIIEYISDPSTGKNKIWIHRIEELAAWVGDDWEKGSILFKMAIPASEFLTKEVLDRLGEYMAPFCDQVLKKCGV